MPLTSKGKLNAETLHPSQFNTSICDVASHRRRSFKSLTPGKKRKSCQSGKVVKPGAKLSSAALPILTNSCNRWTSDLSKNQKSFRLKKGTKQEPKDGQVDGPIKGLLCRGKALPFAQVSSCNDRSLWQRCSGVGALVGKAR